MSLDIHKKIKEKLTFFINQHKIPHIIFHGPSGSGKRTILNTFINDIYENDKPKMNQYVMYVNCAHSKGIRFIRDELKFFAKTNIHNKNNNLFKSIVLFNADKLTMDAQSALRRCIEQFSHTTRFFILVENENRLLKPILSRFCNIHIPLPSINNNKQSLHTFNKKILINNEYLLKHKLWLKRNLIKKANYKDITSCNAFVEKIYEKGYNGIDIIDIIDNEKTINKKNKYLYLIYFDKIRSEYRNEKLFMFVILNLFFMRKNLNLENILEM
uniref:AAA+ ATPase domain-containing protein n=1 Tax=viral metagenome TaxID=1070528 RepID=A0A6C0JBW4_9ZZZZ|tara:strand:+ start:52 stop:864 length:813 start_codon:yes stop_codon:yes gene_type:complete